jgi:hypothetical protein
VHFACRCGPAMRPCHAVLSCRWLRCVVLKHRVWSTRVLLCHAAPDAASVACTPSQPVIAAFYAPCVWLSGTAASRLPSASTGTRWRRCRTGRWASKRVGAGQWPAGAAPPRAEVPSGGLPRASTTPHLLLKSAAPVVLSPAIPRAVAAWLPQVRCALTSLLPAPPSRQAAAPPQEHPLPLDDRRSAEAAAPPAGAHTCC